jgi:RNA polymerase sigma factor (sigma-70 family)
VKIIEDYYKNNYEKKLKLVSRILRGDLYTAEDVVQEAFTRALRFYPTYDDNRGTIDKWFNSIMFNAMHDLQRSAIGLSHHQPENLSVSDLLEDLALTYHPELNNYLLKNIEQVSNEKHKRIFELFFIMGYTSKEISQIEYKTTQTNITTIIMRFKDKLKNANKQQTI